MAVVGRGTVHVLTRGLGVRRGTPSAIFQPLQNLATYPSVVLRHRPARKQFRSQQRAGHPEMLTYTAGAVQ